MQPVIVQLLAESIFSYKMVAIEPWFARFWRATFCTVFNLTTTPFDLEQKAKKFYFLHAKN